MLEKLVEEIRKGGTLETGLLAARLGASPQLVQAMLEHLQRSGLIQPYLNCDTSGCQSCGLHEACSSQTAVRLWQTKAEE
ncbi:MAG: FeoC-like transcriptional regulator [Legionellales bacterium]